jgi:hypothetical protein
MISEFLLFRLNLVDRQDLFERPIKDDSELIRVVERASNERFDVSKQGRRRGYKWALRSPTTGSIGEAATFIDVTFSRELASHRGPIITSDGITQGTSTLNPPTATLVRILIDLRRHVFAIEDVPSIIQTHSGWKTNLQTILSSAAWDLEFTSMFRLDPILPKRMVENRLQTFERVTRLRVTLSIPNPDLGPTFQHLYEEMARGGIRELAQDMRNERGLNVGPETLPRAAIDMAMGGYRKGKIHFYGLSGGQKQEFTVEDDVSRIQVEEVRGFVEGYVAARPSPEVKRLAGAIIQKIDDLLGE